MFFSMSLGILLRLLYLTIDKFSTGSSVRPGVHFMKLKHHFWHLKHQFLHFKCQNMGILNAFFGILNTLFFGISNAILNAKTVSWNFLKVKCHFWHLNALIWHFKCQSLVFMKLTPGVRTSLAVSLTQFKHQCFSCH